MDRLARLDVVDRDRSVGRAVLDRDPLLSELAPRRRMRRHVAAAVPAAAAHQAPVAEALARFVRVVEVGPAEDEMAELVRADADAAVLGHREVRVDLRAVGVERTSRRAPTCATRCARRSPFPPRPDPAWTTMNASTKPLSSLSNGREVHVGVREQRRVARHRPRVRLGIVDARLAAGVGRQRARQAVRADDLAGQRDQVVADFAEVLAHAAGRNLAGREEQVAEVIRPCASSARRRSRRGRR